MSVLLIGSTGMGKSTFGNFLLNPDEDHMFDNQTFATATDNKPMTQEVKVASKDAIIGSGRKVELTLIDTPGLNENATKDLEHMMEIIYKLHECKEIKACALVVKFNAKIDAQYKATLEYYSKLLPGMFENNVIIVMTDYATDVRSETLRKRQRIDVEQVKRNTIVALQQCSNNQISHAPQLFAIDCLPTNSIEMEASQNVRKAILDYIIKTLQPIKVENQMVAKTDYVKQEDAKMFQKLEGEIEGYKKRLKEVNKRSEKVLDDTHEKETEITEIEGEINNLNEKLREKDTAEDVVAEHWSIEEEWRVLRWFTRDFDIESPYEISKHTTWTNGKSEFKEIVQTSRKVSGKVEGNFMRGIYASVTVYTEKRRKYTDEIRDLSRRLERERDNLKRCKAAREEFRKRHKEELDEIELLERCIEKKRADATKCRSDTMTMDDAMSRLKELQKKS